jgi:hypothetical protein
VPIRFMSVLGSVVALLSCIYGIRLTIAALLGHIPVPGFATLAVLLSFFSGLILLMLGTLGEYLWRVFDIVGRKPEAVIDSTFI